MASRSLNTLQAGRALAAVTVLLYHVTVTTMLPKYLHANTFLAFRSGNSGVQFFFVLSGFVIWLAHRKDIGHAAVLKEYLWKRFRRLYPPLWAVLIVSTAIFLIVPSFGWGGETHPSTILSAFLVGPAKQDLILHPEWTLRREVLFYLVFSISIVNKRLGKATMIAWLALSAILPCFNIGYPLNFFFSTFNLLFGLGILTCWLFLRGGIKRPAIIFAAGFTLFAAAWILHDVNAMQDGNGLNLFYGVGAALMMLGLVVVETAGYLQVPGWLVFLGEASYSIYLVNFPAISGALKVMLKLQNKYHLSNYSVYIATSLAALAVSVIFHLIVEKPLIKSLSKITFDDRKRRLVEPTTVA
jgi:exopolysaccharide production protein ExoZ